MKAHDGSPAQPLVNGKRVKPMDPTLRAAAKIDRIMQELPAEMQEWAIAWLKAKYAPVTQGAAK